MSYVLRPDQYELKGKIYSSWGSGNRNVLAVLPTGGGKCHGRDTPIMMFDGSVKPVQEIKIGDFLMGPDSQPRIVINTVKGIDELYKVVPVKGDPYIVNSAHILSLKRTGESKSDVRKGEIVNIPVTQYLAKNKYFKHIHKGWRTSVDFLQNELDFDPYMLGVWLGDGTARTASITTPEPEIISYCKNFARLNDMKITVQQKPDNKAITISLVKRDRSKHVKSYMGEMLARYDLILNKHIPHIFKTASRAERLNLLAGILDTDGHYDGKSFDLIFKSEKLLEDTLFLARSLGFSAYKSPQRKVCTNNGASDIYYRCSINGNLDIIPNKIPRKKAKPREQIKNQLVTGITVEDFGIGEYFGFEIHGPDRLYLLGDFTVTHNSVIGADTVLDHHNAGQQSAVIAHRNELVTQMSLHIARQNIPHRIIGADKTVSQAIAKHRKELGKSFVNPSAPSAVVGVDTLISRRDDLLPWARQISLWVGDEWHHCIGKWEADQYGNPVYRNKEINWLVEPNKWGKAVTMFPNARGLGFTATPQRADGQGLGREYDGCMDIMVQGPSMRHLIEINALSDFEIVCPRSDLIVDDSPLSKDGDWSIQTLKKAAKKSKIVGDTVENYIKYAYGRRAIVFAPDIEDADEMALKFNARGIKAASVNGNSLTSWRDQCDQQFRDGRLDVLINVDLFDEGYDVPACDVIIMARPTASLGKYLQMVGRGLRYVAGKIALIIDQVSNVIRHGLPDKIRMWSLARRDKRAKQMKDPDEIELTECKVCTRPYEKFRTACPHCGAEKPLPEPRSRTIDVVEGDLILLDREMLARMRMATELESPIDIHRRVAATQGDMIGKAAANRQIEKIAAHNDLTETIAQWAAIERQQGYNDREIHKKFYLTLGMDVLTALNAKYTAREMAAITATIQSWYTTGEMR